MESQNMEFETYAKSMTAGKSWLFLGMNAFQTLSVGLSAAGIGLQAAAGGRKPDQPRETEQEKKIQRQSARMAQIRQVRSRSGNHQGLAGPMVNLLNTSVATARGNMATKAGRAAVLSGMGS